MFYYSLLKIAKSNSVLKNTNKENNNKSQNKIKKQDKKKKEKNIDKKRKKEEIKYLYHYILRDDPQQVITKIKKIKKLLPADKIPEAQQKYIGRPLEKNRKAKTAEEYLRYLFHHYYAPVLKRKQYLNYGIYTTPIDFWKYRIPISSVRIKIPINQIDPRYLVIQEGLSNIRNYQTKEEILKEINELQKKYTKEKLKQALKNKRIFIKLPQTVYFSPAGYLPIDINNIETL